MPSLSGYSQAQAEQMLINAGLNVGQITYEDSKDFAQGLVIRQSISGSVDEGTYVDFCSEQWFRTDRSKEQTARIRKKAFWNDSGKNR